MALDDLGFLIMTGATDLIPSMKYCFGKDPYGYENLVKALKEWGIHSEDDFSEYHKTAIWMLKRADMASGINMFHHIFYRNMVSSPDVTMLVARGTLPVSITNINDKACLAVELYFLASRRFYFSEENDTVDIGFAIPVTFVMDKIGGSFMYGFHSDAYDTVTLCVSSGDLSYIDNWKHCLGYEYGKVPYTNMTVNMTKFLAYKGDTLGKGIVTNWFQKIFDSYSEPFSSMTKDFKLPVKQISGDLSLSTIPSQVASLLERNIKSLRKLNRLLDATLAPLDIFDVNNANIILKGEYGDGTIIFQFPDGKELELPFKSELEVLGNVDSINRLVYGPNSFLYLQRSKNLDAYDICFKIGFGSNCTMSDYVPLFNNVSVAKLHSNITKAVRSSFSGDVCLADLPWLSTGEELRKIFEKEFSDYFTSNDGFNPVYDSLLKLFYSEPDTLASLFSSGIRLSTSKIRQFVKANKKQLPRTGLGNKEKVAIPKVAQRKRMQGPVNDSSRIRSWF